MRPISATKSSTIGAIVLVLAALALMSSLGVCVQEDAFISFRYAGNLVEGHGLVYNPGERVEGYSNFLWTVFVALGMKIGLDPVLLSRGMGMLAAVGLIWLVSQAGAGRSRESAGRAGLFAAAIVALSPSVLGEAVQGLETVFFALLVTLGGLLLARGQNTGFRGGAGAGAVLAFAALTRPEGLGVWGLGLLGRTAWRAASGKGLRPGPFERAAVGIFLVLYLPYWLGRATYYGYPFPNTFYAKTGGGWHHVRSGLDYVLRFLVENPVLALLTGLLLLLALRPKPRRGEPEPFPWVAGAIVIGYLGYVVLVGGDFKATFRFVVPVLPLWALLVDRAIEPRIALWGDLPRRFSRLVLVLLVALSLLPAWSRARVWSRVRASELQARLAVGGWLAERAPPDAVLAIHSAGIIPFTSGLYTLDMWGLSDLHIAHRVLPEMGRTGKMGHQKTDPVYVFGREPDLYVDELHYLSREPIGDLKERVLGAASPELRRLTKPYRARSMPIEVEGSTLYFNFLERGDGSP